MRTAELQPNMQVPETFERDELAELNAEIAERLKEMEAKRGIRYVQQYVTKLHLVGTIGKGEALSWVLELMTGDLSSVTESYADAGKRMSKSKQGVQQGRLSMLGAIAPFYPKLVDAIREIRAMKAKPKGFAVKITEEF